MAETGTGHMMVPLVPRWQFEGAKNSSCATWRGSTVVPEFLNKWPIASCLLSDVFHKFLQLDLFSMLIPGFFCESSWRSSLLKVWNDTPPPPGKQVPSLGTMSTSNSTSVTKRRDDDTVFLAKFSPAIFMEGLNLRSCGKNRPSASVGFSTPKWSWKHLWPPFSQNYGGIMPILSKNLLQMLPMVLLSIIRGLKSTGGIH